jgi:uncharacterized protein (TIGR02246 family)
MQDTADPQMKQIVALFMKFDEAFNRSDAAAIAATFTEDAIQVAPEGVFSGRQAIEKRYAESVFQQWHSSNHVGKILELITVGNGICSVGEWSSNARNSNGSTTQANGYFSTVLVREGDTWKIRISTFNFALSSAAK